MDRPPTGIPPEQQPPEHSSSGDVPPEQVGSEAETEKLPTAPTRTLIFHRFDPATAKRGPHFPIVSDRRDLGETTADEQIPESDLPVMDLNKHDVCEEDVNPLTVAVPDAPREKPPAKRRADPILHSLLMLATLFLLLAVARFAVPGIVEEIRYAQHRGQLRAEFEIASEGLKNVSLDTITQAYQMVTAKAGPSVVHIDVRRSVPQTVLHAGHLPTAHPSLSSAIPGAPNIPISDQGSGVVVDSDGYILTNRHVIVGGDELSVTLSDGRKVQAIVVGTDEPTDLAVLKIDADKLIPIEWGDSERIRVGSPVWAIGSPFGLDRTVTFGILSGKHRVVRASDRYQDFMQSDVAVNPGNSGGPLVDARGNLIGINTAIVGDTYQGVSFSIPSKVAKKIFTELKSNGTIERGWLGVSLVDVPDDQLSDGDHRLRGVIIRSLADVNSGAARAGLLPGDLVSKVDDQRVRDIDHLMQIIGNSMAGTRVRLTVIRADQELKLDVLLGRRPPID